MLLFGTVSAEGTEGPFQGVEIRSVTPSQRLCPGLWHALILQSPQVAAAWTAHVGICPMAWDGLPVSVTSRAGGVKLYYAQDR